LWGTIDASGTTKTTMTNTSFTSWHTTGVSTYSPGADTLTNTGLIATNAGGAATTIDFGAGADTFNNSAAGVLVAGEGPQAASNLVLTGLETLNNAGLIVFGSGSTKAPFGSDGFANDQINAAGTAYVGAGGKLAMDANLSTVAQASCAALTAADCLAVGSTAGTTSIIVHDTGAAAAGGANAGIALVTGVSSATNFTLDPSSQYYSARFGGVLDKPGLFFYDLAYNAANKSAVLVGVPDIEVFQLAEIGAQASDLWEASTQTWFDRQADLRTAIHGRSDGWGPGVWLRVVGQWTNRDNTATNTILNKTYTFDVGYHSNTAGLVGGVDLLSSSGGASAYVVGVQAGYLDQDTRFNASPLRVNLSGPTLGAYASFVSGGLYLDGIVNANLMDMDIDDPALAAAPANHQFSGNVDTYGGRVEGGYQMGLGSSAFWEPLVGLSYLHSNFDDIAIAGATVSWPSATSFRGDLGLRVGLTGDFEWARAQVSLTGKYVNEFDGSNQILIASGGPNFTTTDHFDGGFGDVSVGASMFARGGHLSAFANAGFRFQSDYQTTSVTAGFRYQW
jgi:hypothetical protein